MGKGFLTGALFGTVVSALGLLAALLAAPPVTPVGPAEIAVSPAPEAPADLSQQETAAAEPEPEAVPVASAPESAHETVAAAPGPKAAPEAAPETAAAEPEPEPTPAVPAPEVAPVTAAPAPSAAPEPAAPVAEAVPSAPDAVAAPEAVADGPATEPAPGAAAESGEAIFKALNEALAEAKAAAEKETAVPAPGASSTPAAPAAPSEPAAPASETAPAAPVQSAEVKLAAELPQVATPAPAPAVTIDAAPSAAPQASGEAPAGPAAPEPSSEPVAPVAEAAQPAAPAARSLAEGVAQADAPAAAPEPAPQPIAEPAPQVEPAPAAITEPAPEAAPETETADAAPATESGAEGPVVIDIAPRAPLGAANAPKPGFGVAVPGVRINRLPRIGDETAAASTLPGTPIAPPAGEAAPEVIAPVAEPTEIVSAVERFRASFANPENKPVISVLLLDLGAANGGVDPERLAQLGVPVTVAIDPESGDAAARAAAFRLAGDEIAILAPDLPSGATASDMEVSYQAYAAALPEAVALTAAPDAAFLRDRKQAQHLVALLASEGRGIVSYPRGLDPAGQAARGLGLPAASVDRVIDATGEDAAAIQRYLERAAFDAARRPGVVIVGSTSAGTVAALEAWIAGGGKGTVLGPVSVAMAPAN